MEDSVGQVKLCTYNFSLFVYTKFKDNIYLCYDKNNLFELQRVNLIKMDPLLNLHHNKTAPARNKLTCMTAGDT